VWKIIEESIMSVRQSPAVGSQMRPMGIGTVAENRVPSANNVVMVTPLELLPMMQGELAQQSTTSGGDPARPAGQLYQDHTAHR
jgi:hypothetical protein